MKFNLIGTRGVLEYQHSCIWIKSAGILRIFFHLVSYSLLTELSQGEYMMQKLIIQFFGVLIMSFPYFDNTARYESPRGFTKKSFGTIFINFTILNQWKILKNQISIMHTIQNVL